MPKQVKFHPLYEIHRELLEQLQWTYNGSIDWFNGEKLVDSRSAEFMLPKENGELDEDYLRRLRRARWKSLFKQSIETIAGFLSKFSVRPETLAYLGQDRAHEILSNVDLLGSSLEAFLLSCDTASLRDGFCAVLTDFTRGGTGENNRPFFTRIDRSNLIDWSYEYDTSGRMILTRILFVRTMYERQENGGYKLRYDYVEVTSDQYYVRSAYEPATPSESRQEPVVEKTTLPTWESEEEIPHTFGGIPITFYPDNTIVPFETLPPLANIAEANRVWYQVNSDLRESLHFKSNPLFVREGLIQNMDDRPPPIKMGPRHALDVPVGGRVYMVETTGSAIGLNRDYLKDIEDEIRSYTMDFITVGDRTATEAGLIGMRNQATLARFSVRKQSAVEEMFVAFDRWMERDHTGGGIEMDLSQFKIFDPGYFRGMIDLLLAGRIDDAIFWKIASATGAVPPSVDIAEIIESVERSIDAAEPTPVLDTIE